MTQATKVGPQVAVAFPWKAPLGAAMFRRGDAVWVVFDAKARLDVAKKLGADHIIDVNKEDPLARAELRSAPVSPPLAIFILGNGTKPEVHIEARRLADAMAV